RVPHKPSSMAIFMRQKLGYSQKIIEGITLENYDMVNTNAIHIWTMAQKSIFQVFKNPVYAEKTSTFQSDIAVLMEAARAKNTADVLKAYMKVTSDCVDCHQNFRRDQFVRNYPKTAGASK
ncbi:MAG TPA: cytochrome c, partial [Verrucomicrobiae bacterium]|nr:cytochrome c [Verrucomicrobiae bacterium]